MKRNNQKFCLQLADRISVILALCYILVIYDVLLVPGYTKDDIVTLGITNQRETTIAWDKYTGEPLHAAIGNYYSFIIFIVLE